MADFFKVFNNSSPLRKQRDLKDTKRANGPGVPSGGRGNCE